MQVNDLPHIIILQIGDIHYPDVRQKIEADMKDKGFPKGTADAILPIPLQSAIRKIQEICSNKVDAIILCGDLTSRGDVKGYNECLLYLCTALQLGRDGKWTETQVHVVPGNHDVVRENCDPEGVNWRFKFEPLDEAWKTAGFPVRISEAVRSASIHASGLSIVVYSANSCIGCGVTRSFAPEIRDALEAIIGQYELKPADEAFHVKGELLDMPAFDFTSIQNTADDIKNLDINSLPIVVAHHNLLPQATPRIAPYTELVNAGLARAHLVNSGRFVIYCHGHIHDNPIEIVSDIKEKPGSILCISAPHIIEGFNTLRIESSLDGKPLGCVITRYINTRGCDFMPEYCQRISVHPGPWTEHCTTETKDVIELLEARRKTPICFREIATKARRKLSMTESELRLRLLEAEWLRAVALTNNRDLRSGETTEDASRWYVRRI